MAEEEAPSRDEDAHAAFVARALSSPLRLRILRLCRFYARTNKELAELLEVNPGTMLHHVRTLVEAGMLVPEEERTGARGSREIPYKATGLSWGQHFPNQSVVVIEAMRQQLEGVDPDDVDFGWLGLQLNAEHKEELGRRLFELMGEFKDRGPDPDGEPYSLVTIIHPDLNPPPAG